MRKSADILKYDLLKSTVNSGIRSFIKQNWNLLQDYNVPLNTMGIFCYWLNNTRISKYSQ